jgi:hypothetical protein
MQSHSSKRKVFNRYVAGAMSCLATAAAGSAYADEPTTEKELPEVQVASKQDSKGGSVETGYRASTATVGPLGKNDLLNVPMSISVTPSAFINNRVVPAVKVLISKKP